MSKILCVLFVTLSLMGYSQSLNNGLVAFFNFNGGLADDQSSLNLDGTNFGCTPVTGVENVNNSAYFFNASQLDHVDANASMRGITNQVSVSVWIKTTQTGINHIVSKYDWTANAGFYLGVYQDKALFAGRDGSGAFINPGTSTTVVNDGNWHHLVGIINGNVWELYVDCNLEQTFTTTTPVPDYQNTELLGIGYYPQGDAGDFRYFEGTIDEVRIYNRILTPSELDTLCDFNTATSITEASKAPSVNIYPNPFSDYIVIDFPHEDEITFQVYSLTGQMILENGSSRIIQTNQLPEGCYFLKAIDQNGAEIWNEKLIKTTRF